jgi:hypothetical protein
MESVTNFLVKRNNALELNPVCKDKAMTEKTAQSQSDPCVVRL